MGRHIAGNPLLSSLWAGGNWNLCELGMFGGFVQGDGLQLGLQAHAGNG